MNNKVTNLSEIKSPTIVWKDVNEKGKPLPTDVNVSLVLEKSGITVRYNSYSHRLEVRGIPGIDDETSLNVVASKISYIAMRLGLRMSKDALFEALNVIGSDNSYNPLHDYMEECKQVDTKGVDYIRKAWECITLQDHVNDEMKEFYFNCFKKNLINGYRLFYNTLDKQENQEFVIVLQGEQGLGKTRYVKNLLPKEFIGLGLSLDPSNKDSIMKYTKHGISELGELESTTKKENGPLKATLTAPVDEYRAPYERRVEMHPRTTLAVGTVNEERYLNDDTGNRRFVNLPLKDVKQCDFDNRLLWKSVIEAEPEAIVYLTREEIKRLRGYNERYGLQTDIDVAILDNIQKPTNENDKGVATSTMIADYLNSICKGLGAKPRAVGKSLSKLGFEQDKYPTKHGNSEQNRYWHIKPIKDLTLPF